MLSLLHQADLRLLYLVNSDGSNPFLDGFMAFVTDFGFWRWPIMAAAAALLIRGGYRARLLVVLTLVAVLVGEGINGTIKHLTNRPRPHEQLANIRHVDRGGVQMSTPGPVEKGRSLPSSHVANNAAFAVLVGAIYGRWGRVAWLGVLVVAYSRIYIGSHYPSDVLVSLALALSYSNATLWVTRRLWRALGPKWTARLYRRYPDLLPTQTELGSAGLSRSGVTIQFEQEATERTEASARGSEFKV
ncbi:MAG: phosphatase PAP2 family protein [Verrucomicrobia bacterium]|nr:phosphatase PAP2 family protein [Verrucomicrobiota bacterium]